MPKARPSRAQAARVVVAGVSASTMLGIVAALGAAHAAQAGGAASTTLLPAPTAPVDPTPSPAPTEPAPPTTIYQVIVRHHPADEAGATAIPPVRRSGSAAATPVPAPASQQPPAAPAAPPAPAPAAPKAAATTKSGGS